MKWSNPAYPTHCLRQAAGPIVIRTGTATTWTGGVKMSWVLPGTVNVTSQSGYNDKTSITFNFTQSGKYLCGRHNVPGRSNAGYLMADWKDR